MIRILPWALALLLGLLPAAAAGPAENETCETILLVESCEGTRSDASSSCTEPPAPPGTNTTHCTSTESEEQYQSVEVLGIGVEYADLQETQEMTFDASHECHDEQGQALVTSHGHALRAWSPAGGAWVEANAYEAQVEEQATSECGDPGSVETEEETVQGHVVTIGTDAGPQPVVVEARAERSDASLQQTADGGNTSWMNITGIFVAVSINDAGMGAVVGVFHHDDGAGCERVGAVVLWPPLPNQFVASGCLPTRESLPGPDRLEAHP